MQNVKVTDEGLLDALDSISHELSKDSLGSLRKLVWYIMFSDDNFESSSERIVELCLVPSNYIIPVMKESDGYFYYHNNLYFIENRDEKRRQYDSIFEYLDKTRIFYYITIDWKLFWGSNMEESKKNTLYYKYASIEDYPSIFLSRDSDYLWRWKFSMF